MTAERLDAAFAALADPTRRAIVSRLARGDATVGELAAPFDMSLPGISKHLKVLERSGLISRRRDAQFRPCHLEVEALNGALGLDRREPAHVGRALRQARCAAGRHHAGTRTDGATQGKGTHQCMSTVPTAPNELRFSRIFDAPRELVFRCMTDTPTISRTSGGPRVSAHHPRPYRGRRPAGRGLRDRDGQRQRRQRVPRPVPSTTRCARPSCCRGPSRTPACR